jgi:hypothetical protein
MGGGGVTLSLIFVLILTLGAPIDNLDGFMKGTKYFLQSKMVQAIHNSAVHWHIPIEI